VSPIFDPDGISSFENSGRSSSIPGAVYGFLKYISGKPNRRIKYTFSFSTVLEALLS
jgi:hypothetical protein